MVDKVVIRRLGVRRGREVDAIDLAHVLDMLVRACKTDGARVEL